MTEPKGILLIEDDVALSTVLKRQLELSGYTVETATDGESGLAKAFANIYAVILTDVSLPKMNGLTILIKLRESKVKTPVIVMTNFNQDENEYQSYAQGANIFHRKPVNFKLLDKQIKMLISNFDYNTVITIGDIEVDASKKTLKKAGVLIKLTKREFQFFLTLVKSPGEVFSRKEIINITGMSRMDAIEGSVDTLISRIRNKVGKYKNKDVIETAYGQGYRLSLDYLE